MFRRLRNSAWWRYDVESIPFFIACLIGIVGFFGYYFAARVCSWNKPGRMCSYDQLVTWFRDENAWLALLIASAALAVLGFFTWLGYSLDESAPSEPPAEVPDKTPK